MPKTTERDTLVIQCHAHGLDHTGTTHQLRKRLLAHMMHKDEPAAPATPSTAPQKKKDKQDKSKRQPSA